MKNTLKYIIAFSVFVIASYSCNKNLNEKLYHDAAQESYIYTDAYQAINILYANMRGMFGHTNYFGVNETTSDELVMPANASGWDDGGIYKSMHLHTWNSLTPQLANMWNRFYPGVINANNLLAQLDAGRIPVPSGVTKEAIASEIRVARAFFYWLILDNFGDAALITTTSKDLPVKTSRKEIYNFVVKEINDALPNLSEDNNQLMYGRFNKWAAKVLLANLYLNAQVYAGDAKWNECIAQCNDIIASGKYQLEATYKNNFITENQNSKEIVFAIPFDENLAGGLFFEMFSWHAALRNKVNMQATPWGSGSAMGVSQFIDTYDTDDSRLNDTWISGPQFALDGVTPLKGSYDKAGQQLVFTKNLPNGLYTGESEGYRMNKFEVKTGAQYTLSNDFPFFRYAEVLMMKAECLLRTGNAADAASIVTNVRARNFKSKPAKATVTASQLSGNSKYKYGYVENYQIVDQGDVTPLQYGGMLDELGWEFAWEAHRRRDDIRFGVFATKSWLSHKPNGANRTTFMIPQSVTNANPNLK